MEFSIGITVMALVALGIVVVMAIAVAIGLVVFMMRRGESNRRGDPGVQPTEYSNSDNPYDPPRS